MKAEEILDVLVLFQGLWPHRPLTKEIAERLASHFAKMSHEQVRWAVLKLSDESRFPPSFAEIRQKIRDLDLAGHFKRKAEGRVKPKSESERRRIENKRAELKYLRENGRITHEQYDEEMKSLGSTHAIGDVLETAFGGRFKEYAALGRRLITGEISREQYERERENLDAKKD